MKMLILGPPGTGKGTLAKKLSSEIGYIHISTGDMVREEIKKGTKLGEQIAKLINGGNLVPDDIMIRMLKGYLPKDNYILDGFPRTLPQAKELEKIVSLDYVIYLNTGVETIIKRLTSRRQCEDCGEIYGMEIKSEKKGYCNCGGKLYQRDDDKEDVIRTRLKVYEKDTKPLLNFYKKKLIEINGEQKPEKILRDVLKYLKK